MERYCGVGHYRCVHGDLVCVSGDPMGDKTLDAGDVHNDSFLSHTTCLGGGDALLYSCIISFQRFDYVSRYSSQFCCVCLGRLSSLGTAGAIKRNL